MAEANTPSVVEEIQTSLEGKLRKIIIEDIGQGKILQYVEEQVVKTVGRALGDYNVQQAIMRTVEAEIQRLLPEVVAEVLARKEVRKELTTKVEQAARRGIESAAQNLEQNLRNTVKR